MAYPSLTTNAIAQTGMATTGIGSVIGAVGNIESGYSNANAAKYQAQVAENNSAIAGRNAEFATQEGNVQAENQGLKNRSQAGSIIANTAANGIDVNSGSAKQVQQSQQILGNLDAMTIRSNAAREAYGYQTQAQNFTAEAALKSSEAKNDVSAGFMGAGSSLLSGASSLGKQYSAWVSESGNSDDSQRAVLAGG